ncbi:LRC14 protein, partial [Neopipo cinnamomea]|nr:LRC14 protein [Neopipo cinnamomea]
MDSLLFLSARRLVSHRPLPAVPSRLYPVLFQAAFLDGRLLVLQDLVARWPFPVLDLQLLVGRRELLRGRPSKLCVQSVILAVVRRLRRGLEGTARDSGRCRLRVLDVTGLGDAGAAAPDGMSVWSGTVALAKACLEVSKLQRELRKRGAGSGSGAAAAAAPPPAPVDVRADLFVNATSYGVVWDALRAGKAGPLRLRCREFQAEELCPAGIANLLESLDPRGLRRVELRFNNLGLEGLCSVLPHLSRFPELRSLRLPYSNVDVRRPTPEAARGIRRLAGELGKLRSLQELGLGSSRLSGNLGRVLRELQSPLESLELPFCSLLPADLSFLSRSLHARALKLLDLSGHDLSRGLFPAFRRLLEESSASLLQLELSECRLEDPGLAALLPPLRLCRRLRRLGLAGNRLSTAALRDLLRECAGILPELRLVVVPIPADCAEPDPGGIPDAGGIPELSRALESAGRADVVCTSNAYGHEFPDFFSV